MHHYCTHVYCILFVSEVIIIVYKNQCACVIVVVVVHTRKILCSLYHSCKPAVAMQRAVVLQIIQSKIISCYGRFPAYASLGWGNQQSLLRRAMICDTLNYEDIALAIPQLS